MVFGASFRNDLGTTVLGEGIVPVVLSNETRNVSAEFSDGRVWYDPPRIDGMMPCFTMRASINRFEMHGRQGNDSDYPIYSPELFVFNNNSDLGTLTFSYLALGDVLTYPSGGYGIVIFDSNGNITFHSSTLLLSSENTARLMSDDTIQITNGTRVCPLMWYYAPSFQTDAIRGKIERNGSGNFFTATRDTGAGSQSGYCGSLLIF